MPVPAPKNDDDRINAIRLYRCYGIGPQAYHTLMAQCESWADVFESLKMKQKAVGEERLKIATEQQARAEYAHGQSLGTHFLMEGAPEYPTLLMDADDRPPFLWALGNLNLLDEKKIAIIGSRNPSIEGVRMTSHLAKLCNYSDIVVVSGLARGIDAAAHEAALSRGTIGVVAGGVDVCYPKSNAQLQMLMSEHGLVLSEQPFGLAPKARDFPKRNRIIAGLVSAVLVVEANERSGTKLTVNDARAYGRSILAVPGHPFHGLAALPNQLIKEGARMVTDIDDILDELSIEVAIRERYFKQNPQHNLEKEQAKQRATEQTQSAIEMGRSLLEGDGVMGLDGEFRKI